MSSRSVARGSVIPLATLLLLALAAAGPLWGPGLLNTRGGGDSPFNLLRVHQLAANLRAGVFPARWMPDAAYGFGYPFFNYYSALPYYLAAGLAATGLDVLSAVKLTQTLFFAAAALGMYGWARRALRSRAGAWLAAVAYTLAPYHLVNVYVRGDSLSEFAAFAFYPLILWGLDRLAAHPCLRRTIPPALAYAGLILTHNLSALIFSPFILLYAAIHISRTTFHVSRFTFHASRFKLSKLLTTALLLATPLLLGILLSTWYWLPTLAEIGAVQLTEQTSGYFAYDQHFRGADLVQLAFVFDYYAITPDAPTGFAAMGLAQAVLALAGVAVAVVGWVRRRGPGSSGNGGLWAFALAGLALTTWLVTPLSRPVWDHLTPLQMVQFPWRILSAQALFAALLAGGIAAHLRRWWSWATAAALVILLAVAGLAGLRPDYLPIAAEEVTVERLQLYELFTGNVGSTIRYEYLPRRVEPRPYTGPALLDPDGPPRAIPLGGEIARAEETSREPARRTWVVETGAEGAEVAFPIYYWPGWQATVDGAPVETWPAPDSGYLALAVPPGRHDVEMWLGHTPLRLGAELASLATALALAVLGTVWWRRGAGDEGHEAQEAEGKDPSIRHFAFCLAGLAIALVLLVALSPRVTASGPSDLTMDFDRQPYLHHNPGGVDLGGWRLTGYRYSADRLAPGETLRVTLGWELERPEAASATLQLVPPAAVRRKELPALAEAAATIAPGSEGAPLELAIPRDAGPGLYLVRLEGEAGHAYLQPVWIGAGEPAVDVPAIATFADGTVLLHGVEAVQATPGRLDLRLTWSAAGPIAANYRLSLRLTDPAGNEWARLDTQPGYGFLPTSLWPAGRSIHDRYALPLPAGAPPGDGYTLTVILYRGATGEALGKHTHPVSLERATLRPGAPVAARFGDELALSRLEVPERVRQGETLGLTAYWLAVDRPAADYVAGWRLEGAGQAISATLPLAPGSRPAGWPAGAWVAGRAALPIPSTAPPGEYTLSLALLDPAGGAPLGHYTHPRPVRVEGRERVWELPPMQREVRARFGDRPGGLIELAGYDLEREGEALRLALHWRALAAPERHYKFFVHLADPATGHPVAQVDAMPLGSTYPTGMWAPGEVVSDEVGLSLEGVPAGRYELAVGWYDPDDPSDRLRAFDGAGNPLPGDRLVLPDSITLP